jgi:hypothetical protein
LTHNCAGYVTEEVREKGMIVAEENVKKNKIKDSGGHSGKIMLKEIVDKIYIKF